VPPRPAPRRKRRCREEALLEEALREGAAELTALETDDMGCPEPKERGARGASTRGARG
jgi:hypothetical protein